MQQAADPDRRYNCVLPALFSLMAGKFVYSSNHTQITYHQVDVKSTDGATCASLVLDDERSLLHLFQSEPKDTSGVSEAEQTSVLKVRLTSLGNSSKALYDNNHGIHSITFTDTASKLTIKSNNHSLTISLTSLSAPFVTADFDLDRLSCFGFGHLMYQHWPLNKSALVLSPAYPFDNGPTGLSTVLDPTFVTSSGVVLSIHDDSPCLHVAINAPVHHALTLDPPFAWTTGLGNLHRQILPQTAENDVSQVLTFQSRRAYDHTHVAHPWSSQSHASTNPCLTFTVSTAKNIKEATVWSLGEMRSKYGSAPISSAKIGMMQYPIWSTWAQYKRDIDQKKVLSFASQIVEQGYPRSVMGIDDCWSASYGELRFDPLKFPNPREMVEKLHNLGFKVTLWVTPFSDVTSPPLLDPETRCHYVVMPNGEIGDFEWWQPGRVAALDVTNPDACAWFVGKLRGLCNDYGIDGFKFDAGEPCFLPLGSVLHSKLQSPNDYTRGWIHNIAAMFPIAEVRSAVRGCQSASPMFRIFDKYSTWDLRNGLASVLAAVLTSGILGFPFCVPDYIAGNAYGDDVPDAELMIRWTQATTAMPALQFSIPPWRFESDDCSVSVKRALLWREKLFWPHIKACINDASEKLWPIVRPIWWEEPELVEAQQICDEFMVGSDLLVAPIVVRGQRTRAVFLPQGVWQRVDMTTCTGDGKDIVGPIWLQMVAAGLDNMPVFLRKSDIITTKKTLVD